MASKAVIPFLVAMMLLTGVCNTLLTKYQDMQCVHNCDSKDPKKRQYFEQPIFQTLNMFIGEMGCWLVIGGFSVYTRYISRDTKYSALSSSAPEDPLLANDEDSTLGEDDEDDDNVSILASTLLPTDGNRIPLTGWKVTLLALPAMCDIIGTTLMNLGFLFVAASIYQMTRGALVLFVGLFSVIFLKRHLSLYKWFALLVVVSGVALVGLAGAIEKDHKAVPSSLGVVGDLLRMQGKDSTDRPIETSPSGELSVAVKTVIGILLIAAAQIFTATQFVLEESIMEKYSLEPLRAVGWEGIWGFVFTALGMVILHFAIGRTDAGRGGYFDAAEGLWQVFHYRKIALTSVAIMFSIGGFNFFGLSVTRTVSATARSTIDTCRTLFIWIVSLGLGWETFKWLQVAGFALLVYGTFLFNDIVRPPLKACLGKPPRDEEAEEIFPERPAEHR